MLKRVGWTQAELARQAHLEPSRIGEIINLIKRPTPKQADAIQLAFSKVGEFLDVLSEWPETFEGLKRGYRREQTAEFEMDRLIDHPEVLQLAAPENTTYESDELRDQILNDFIEELPEKTQTVMRERFWHGMTLKQVAKKINRQPERVRQIEAKTLRRMRHPEIVKQLLEGT